MCVANYSASPTALNPTSSSMVAIPKNVQENRITKYLQYRYDRKQRNQNSLGNYNKILKSREQEEIKSIPQLFAPPEIPKDAFKGTQAYRNQYQIYELITFTPREHIQLNVIEINDGKLQSKLQPFMEWLWDIQKQVQRKVAEFRQADFGIVKQLNTKLSQVRQKITTVLDYMGVCNSYMEDEQEQKMANEDYGAQNKGPEIIDLRPIQSKKATSSIINEELTTHSTHYHQIRLSRKSRKVKKYGSESNKAFGLIWKVKAREMQISDFNDQFETPQVLRSGEIISRVDQQIVKTQNGGGKVSYEEHLKPVKHNGNILNDKYYLNNQFGRGSFGEVWRARRYVQPESEDSSGSYTDGLNQKPTPQDKNETFVLKKIHSNNKSGPLYQSGIREIYFLSKFKQAWIFYDNQVCLNQNLEQVMAVHDPWICKNMVVFDRLVGFEEAFTQDYDEDLWLVLQDAGTSLQHVMYSSSQPMDFQPPSQPQTQPLKIRQQILKSQPSSNNAVLIEQSSLYSKIKQDQQLFQEITREIIKQTAQGLAAMHTLNVTHRDIKPSNVMIKFTNGDARDAQGFQKQEQSQNNQDYSYQQQSSSEHNYQQNIKIKYYQQHGNGIEYKNESSNNNFRDDYEKEDNDWGQQRDREEIRNSLWSNFTLRIIDFGSAVDYYTLSQMYGTRGPTIEEQTLEYSPPEIIFGNSSYWNDSISIKQSWQQDIWSLGVLWLEFVTGSPYVFDIGEKNRAVLHQKVRKSDQNKNIHKIKKNLEIIKGFTELCIYPPINKQTKQHLIEQKCSEINLLKVIQEKDKAKIGLANNTLALRLLRNLLDWNSYSRPQAKDILNHAFFILPLKNQTEGTYQCSKEFDVGWC